VNAPDRELLEMAAKAAGITLLRSRLDDPMCKDMLLVARKLDGEAIGWNPLTDDGDALRLAVKVDLTVYAPERTSTGLHVCVVQGFGPDAPEVWERVDADPCTATRRAVVRAAAEIGRAA
jgi:hypothetical protein